MKFIVLIILVLLAAASYSDEHANSSNILYLNSYHSGFGWSDSIEQGFKETVQDAEQNVVIYFERMDSKRFPLAMVAPNVKDAIVRKYANLSFDAIVTSDDNAFNFALELRSEYFKDTPIIFSGVNNYEHPSFAEKPNLTGVMESVDILGLLTMIQEVHPNVGHIAIIGDSTSSAQIHIENTQAVLEKQFTQLTYSVHSNWTMESLAKELEGLPSNTVIIELAFHLDNEGTFLSFDDEKRFLESTTLPSYSLWDNRIGYGVLGGVMTSGKIHGQQAGQLLISLLNGTSIDDLPIIQHIPFPKYFDYQQMVRLNVSQSDLPDDAEILDYPDTFWFKYRQYLVFAITFVLIQSLMIIFLVQNVVKRKAAQLELKTLNDELEVRIKKRTEDLSKALENLKRTQSSLIESEKMASLGGIVSGMAHKLNTPIGICKTATSLLIDNSKNYDNDTNETISLLESNLNYLSSFITDFRQISVDLASEKSEKIDIGPYIEEIISCRESVLKLGNINYRVDCETSLSVKTYPSVLSKIFFIFIQNSVLHGFSEPQENRYIEVLINSDSANWYIHYRDNGKGVTDEIKSKIFEPFFTTNFGIGTGGLGLNIVYNEVVHRLHGEIAIDQSWSKGLALVLTLPKDIV